MSEDLPPRRRKKRPSESRGSGKSLIPTDNGAALAGDYCAIFSLIPCVALLLGPAGVVLGIMGLNRFNENPRVHGQTHAYVGIILGGLTSLVNYGIVLVSLLSMAGN